MASTRSNTTPLAARSASAETPRRPLLALLRRAAHVQVAACTAAATTVAEWAQSADRLAQAVGDELLRRVDGEADSAELAARVTRAGGAHLREVGALPRKAADHFDRRVAGSRSRGSR